MSGYTREAFALAFFVLKNDVADIVIQRYGRSR